MMMRQLLHFIVNGFSDDCASEGKKKKNKKKIILHIILLRKKYIICLNWHSEYLYSELGLMLHNHVYQLIFGISLQSSRG